MHPNLRPVSGFSYVGGGDSYQKSTWSLGDKYIKEYNDWFLEQQTQFLLGRYPIVFMALWSHQKLFIHPLCQHTYDATQQIFFGGIYTYTKSLEVFMNGRSSRTTNPAVFYIHFQNIP